ncbi:hypothetical protein M404DRAFT_32090 [Pisolithus tinctorius Marx 270]|uniref:Uncharacterized protein n=1 Tax=Pisolithus tinctorius Marx 270 TaxID=870435 RepID=A0A0C3N963_PISTI|nr:hypothetical protein M404DRAFT_32090 [Pisolithus tinctorius Marx 270]
MPTLDPVEVEKTTLKEQLAATLAGLVAEAWCMPDNWDGLLEEKMTWLWRWEEKTAVLMPLVKQGKELGITICVDMVDVLVLAKADDVYERWTAEEADACMKAKQDVQIGEEPVVEPGDKGAAVMMSHVEVPQPACKQSCQTMADTDKDSMRPNTQIPAAGTITHKDLCMQCALKKV